MDLELIDSAKVEAGYPDSDDSDDEEEIRRTGVSRPTVARPQSKRITSARMTISTSAGGPAPTAPEKRAVVPTMKQRQRIFTKCAF